MRDRKKRKQNTKKDRPMETDREKERERKNKLHDIYFKNKTYTYTWTTFSCNEDKCGNVGLREPKPKDYNGSVCQKSNCFNTCIIQK